MTTSVTPSTARQRMVFVVEDSPTQAAALEALLTDNGYDVQLYRTGEAALEALQGNATPFPDLVLSDVIMPGMNGYTFCRTVKDDPALRDIPVMLLTSLTDPLDIIRGLECGADNYVTKPYDADQLLARLSDVFTNRELRARIAPGDGISITFLGERFTVHSTATQILDLLVSSFEELVRTNATLRETEAERARLYELERAARVEAEKANRAKSEFLTAMSHDLRTPLNAIGGYSELMVEGVQGPITPEQRTYLERIMHNQKNLLALVNDVLNFARVEHGGLSVDLRDVRMRDVLAGARAVIEPQVLTKGISFHIAPCDETLVVHADAERVDQILMNLLANATKFTPSGGSISVGCRSNDKNVTIEVRDTGIGIPADRLKNIFDPFVQVDARRTVDQQGVGLGLAISQNLAQLMGGRLTVDSTLGEGSRFCLTLPRATPPA